MPEEKKEVKTFITNYLCDVCGRGCLVPNGFVRDCFPEEYCHKCRECGAETFISGCQYPIVTYALLEN